MPRNLILRYSKEHEWVLDQFLGSGTTLVEAKLLNRNSIGVDINEESIFISRKNIKLDAQSKVKVFIKQGDARNLYFIKDESIDLICMHPPYANIIRYSKDVDGDISLLPFESFLDEMKKVACESFRILKNGKICTVMIGDIRKKGNVIPLGFQVMNCFLKAGFKSKEIIIKEQYNCKSTEFWSNQQRAFLMLAHEYIFVFVK